VADDLQGLPVEADIAQFLAQPGHPHCQIGQAGAFIARRHDLEQLPVGQALARRSRQRCQQCHLDSA